MHINKAFIIPRVILCIIVYFKILDNSKSKRHWVYISPLYALFLFKEL